MDKLFGPKSYRCPDCHGTGLIDEREQPPTPCPTCWGAGRWEYSIIPKVELDMIKQEQRLKDGGWSV